MFQSECLGVSLKLKLALLLGKQRLVLSKRALESATVLLSLAQRVLVDRLLHVHKAALGVSPRRPLLSWSQL